MSGEEDESGSTATVMLIGNDMLFISHVGDSSVVCIQSYHSFCSPQTSWLFSSFFLEKCIISKIVER